MISVIIEDAGVSRMFGHNHVKLQELNITVEIAQLN